MFLLQQLLSCEAPVQFLPLNHSSWSWCFSSTCSPASSNFSYDIHHLSFLSNVDCVFPISKHYSCHFCLHYLLSLSICDSFLVCLNMAKPFNVCL